MEEFIRTVEVQDCVTACDIEGEAAVELDALVDNIRRDADVGEEVGGSDHEPLDGGCDGRDRVGIVERIKLERARVAPDLV